MSGKEIWDAAEHGTKLGCERSANVMRLYALSRLLAEAETAVLTGEDASAAEKLRHLQAYCEKMIERLAPKAKPQLIEAA